MKKFDNELMENEDTINDTKSNISVDITSDQIINLEDVDQDNINNAEIIDESEPIEINGNDENVDHESIDEMENRLKMMDNSTHDNNSSKIASKNIDDFSFMDNIKKPLKDNNDIYALKNVLPKLNNGELEYMAEMKKQMFNRKELIFIYPRMFFWKKRKAKKINEAIIMEQEAEFQDNYQNVLAMRNEYKNKINDYEKKQRKYKESLFKL